MNAPSVVIVNPFDPLHGEETREARYMYLARRLAERGFEVTRITSDWSHRRKQPRDLKAILRAAEAVGVRVEFVKTLPYSRNVSLRRLRSHARFSKDAVRLLEKLSPAVVIASSPPPELADGVVSAAHRMGARAIVDVRDLWPEEFERFWPRGLKWLNPLVFRRMRTAFGRACRSADALVGVAEAYLAEARRFGRTEHAEVIHLGVDVAAFDEAARRGRNLLADEVEPHRPVLFWGGTIASGTDWPGVIDAVARLVPQYPGLLLAVMGTGPDVEAMQQRARDRGIQEHVRLLGFQPYEVYVPTLCHADVTVNALHVKTASAFPNRAFGYMAAGKPIVNSVEGEVADLIETEGIGLNYPAGSAEAMADAFARLLADASLRREMGQRARRLAEDRFDRQVEYERYIRLCETLAAAT
ncbi:MAG: glycosyltransferase family 4 protein [Phycisphaerae bacterium]